MKPQLKVVMFAVLILAISAFYSSFDAKEAITGRFFGATQGQSSQENQAESSDEEFLGVWPSIDGKILDQPYKYYFNVYMGKMKDLSKENDKSETNIYNYWVVLSTRAQNEKEWTFVGRIGDGARSTALKGYMEFYIDNTKLPYGKNIVKMDFFKDDCEENCLPVRVVEFSVYNNYNLNKKSSTSVTGMAPADPPSKPPKAPPVTTPGTGPVTPNDPDDDYGTGTPNKVPKPCICESLVVYGKKSDESKIPQNILAQMSIGDKSIADEIRWGLGPGVATTVSGSASAGSTHVVYAKVSGNPDKCKEYQRFKWVSDGRSFSAGPAPWHKNNPKRAATPQEYIASQERKPDEYVPETQDRNDPRANTYQPDSYTEPPRIMTRPTYDKNKNIAYASNGLPIVKGVSSKIHNHNQASDRGEIAWFDSPGTSDLSQGQVDMNLIFHAKIINEDGSTSFACDKYFATKFKARLDSNAPQGVYREGQFFGPDENYDAKKVQEAAGWPLVPNEDTAPDNAYE